MDKILIQVHGDTIHFKKKSFLNTNHKNLINTNVISESELVFSEEYIQNNLAIVSAFIKELAYQQGVCTAYVYKSNCIINIISALNTSSTIKNLVIQDDILITNEFVEIVKSNSFIETLSVYNMYDFFIEYLDKHGKIVEVRNELFFTSNFIKNNELNKYSSLFYKKNINLEFPFSDEDLADFITFIEINKYLKVIHINKCAKSHLEEVINILKLHNKKNINIIIHQNISEQNLIEYIKKINSNLKRKNNISINLSYSDNYLNNNLLPQTNINILKACIYLILMLVIGTYLFYIFNNYNDYISDNNLKSMIDEVIENSDTDTIIKNFELENNSKVVNAYIASLMTINTDVVGWIAVPGTSIDYPIVLTDNNDYYLTHNITGDYTRYGSIFMNSVNNKNFNDDNTILFGHNFYGSSVMFSTLKNISTDDWLNNLDEYTITIDSLYKSSEYKVFSYYTTNITTDYLTTNFINNLSKIDFYNTLKNKSEYDFDITLNDNDSIITLSTCTNSGSQRFVVHAVLIK